MPNGSAEMILVPVERRDRRRLSVDMIGYDDLELELLLALVRREQPAAPAEERIVRRHALTASPSREQLSSARDPVVAPGDHDSGCPRRTSSRMRNICMRAGSSDGS